MPSAARASARTSTRATFNPALCTQQSQDPIPGRHHSRSATPAPGFPESRRIGSETHPFPAGLPACCRLAARRRCISRIIRWLLCSRLYIIKTRARHKHMRCPQNFIGRCPVALRTSRDPRHWRVDVLGCVRVQQPYLLNAVATSSRTSARNADSSRRIASVSIAAMLTAPLSVLQPRFRAIFAPSVVSVEAYEYSDCPAEHARSSVCCAPVQLRSATFAVGLSLPAYLENQLQRCSIPPHCYNG